MFLRNLLNRNARPGSNRRSRDTRRAYFRKEMSRNLHVEALEDRRMLALTLDLIGSSDTGQSFVDNVTNSAAPTIVATYPALPLAVPPLIPAGPATIYLRGPGPGVPIPIGIIPIGGATTLTAPLVAGDGSYSLTASAAVQVGSVFGTADGVQYQVLSSNTLNIDLDTTAAAPSDPDMLASSDSGTLDTDNITNIQSPAFSGTGEAGALVHVLANDVVVGEGTVASDGTWEVTVEPLIDGEYEITAQQIDVAGNLSPDFTLDVLIDTVVPPVTVDEIDPGMTDTGVAGPDGDWTITDRVTSDTATGF